MQYYQGYLLPVQVNGERTHHVGKSKKAKEKFKNQIQELKLRINELEKNKAKMDDIKQNIIKDQFPYIHCNFLNPINSDLQIQNKKLKQQNKILNLYYHYFSKLYQKQKQQIQLLKKQNSFLLADARKHGRLNQGHVFSKIQQIIHPKPSKQKSHHKQLIINLLQCDSKNNDQFSQSNLSRVKSMNTKIRNRQLLQKTPKIRIDMNNKRQQQDIFYYTQSTDFKTTRA